MPWTWVRPADPSLLAGRPLLDLGTGDGQTLAALVTAEGLVVGVDRSPEALRAASRATPARLAAAAADRLPFRDGTFAAVLAADLFHHLDDVSLGRTLEEVRRVLRPDGRVVAWWYERPGRGGPGDPAYPRRVDSVAAIAGDYRVEPLRLEVVEGTPGTVGAVVYPSASS